MSGKSMTLTFLKQNHVRNDWQVDLGSDAFTAFLGEMSAELSRYDIRLDQAVNDSIVISINSYGDLLNSIRISSPQDGFISLCVGHIIGASANLNLQEDIAKAVRRVAFAPETVPPEDHNRKICHNCGCGC